MIFNKRRQSKDKNVIADIIKTIEDKKIYVSEYSKPLFPANTTQPLTSSTIFYNTDNTYIFAEDILPENILSRTDNLIIYRWNTDYPYDIQFNYDLSQFKLTASIELIGNSHKTITKEIYINDKN